MLGHEIEVLKTIRKKEKAGKFEFPYDYIPQVVSKGMFVLDDPGDQMVAESNEEGKSFMSYYVMPKFGRNLENLFHDFDCVFSDKTILQIGFRLLEIIEKIHDSGFTYNDLKLDNILIGDQSLKEKSMHKIRLIDFGFAAAYLKPDGSHIDPEETDVFRSNMIFASSNIFNF